MEYRLPKKDDEQDIKELLEEYFRNGEREVIICQDMLLDDFDKWIWNAKEGNGDWGKSLLLLCLNDSRLTTLFHITKRKKRQKF